MNLEPAGKKFIDFFPDGTGWKGGVDFGRGCMGELNNAFFLM